MNKYTEAAAVAADRALATSENTRPRTDALAEAQALATVGDAIDRAELLALESVVTLERAVEMFDLVPRDRALDLATLSEDARAAVELIIEADADEAKALGVALYPRNEGAGYDAQRVGAASAVLGLTDEERAALGAWYGYTVESRPGAPVPAGDVTPAGEELSDAGGMVETDFDTDAYMAGIAEEAEKAAKKAKGKKAGKR